MVVVVSLVRVMKSPGTQTTNKYSNNPSVKKGSKGGRSSKSGQSNESPGTQTTNKYSNNPSAKKGSKGGRSSKSGQSNESPDTQRTNKNSNNPSAKKGSKGGRSSKSGQSNESPGTQTTSKNSNNPSAKKGSKAGSKSGTGSSKSGTGSKADAKGVVSVENEPVSKQEETPVGPELIQKSMSEPEASPESLGRYQKNPVVTLQKVDSSAMLEQTESRGANH